MEFRPEIRLNPDRSEQVPSSLQRSLSHHPHALPTDLSFLKWATSYNVAKHLFLSPHRRPPAPLCRVYSEPANWCGDYFSPATAPRRTAKRLQYVSIFNKLGKTASFSLTPEVGASCIREPSGLSKMRRALGRFRKRRTHQQHDYISTQPFRTSYVAVSMWYVLQTPCHSILNPPLSLSTYTYTHMQTDI